MNYFTYREIRRHTFDAAFATVLRQNTHSTYTIAIEEGARREGYATMNAPFFFHTTILLIFHIRKNEIRPDIFSLLIYVVLIMIKILYSEGWLWVVWGLTRVCLRKIPRIVLCVRVFSTNIPLVKQTRWQLKVPTLVTTAAGYGQSFCGIVKRSVWWTHALF